MMKKMKKLLLLSIPILLLTWCSQEQSKDDFCKDKYIDNCRSNIYCNYCINLWYITEKIKD